jgi:hypothetical protein
VNHKERLGLLFLVALSATTRVGVRWVYILHGSERLTDRHPDPLIHQDAENRFSRKSSKFFDGCFGED